MKNIVLLLVIGAAIWYWQLGGLPGMSKPGAYDDNGNPEVWVFTVEDCGGYCEEGLAMLNKRGVPFRELRLNPANPEDENFKLWKKMGRGAFPFFVSGEQKAIGTSKNQLACMLGNNFGETYLTKSEKKYFSKHFNPDGTPKIIMYGADWCPYCAKLRDELTAAGMDFVEIDVEKRKDKEKLMQVMEIPGYPTTFYGYSRAMGSKLSDIKKLM